MPEKDIRPKETAAIIEWALRRSLEVSDRIPIATDVSNQDIPASLRSDFRFFVYGSEEDDALVMRVETNPKSPTFLYGRLFCSGGDAKRLEEAGIVKFSKEPQQGAQTP